VEIPCNSLLCFALSFVNLINRRDCAPFSSVARIANQKFSAATPAERRVVAE
jgi:hypothetical protein